MMVSTKLDFHSDSSLQQKFEDKTIASLIPSPPVFGLYTLMLRA